MRCKKCDKRKKIYAIGLCSLCYQKERYKRQSKNRKWREKTNETHRKWYVKNIEKMREVGRKQAKKYIRKKMKEDPDWNARKQREFRKKHPGAFNYLMCRYYFRKLSKDKRNDLIEEVGGVKK